MGRLTRATGLPILEVLSGAAEDFGAGLVGTPDPNTLGGQFKQAAQFACRAWARGPSFGLGVIPPDAVGRIAGYATPCTPYLESIGEAPTPGSVSGNTCFGTLTYEFGVGGTVTGQQPVGNIRSDWVEEKRFNVVISGQTRAEAIYAVWPGDEVLLVFADQAGVFINEIDFVCDTPPTTVYNPPTSLPGLPPLPPGPTIDTPFGPVSFNPTFNPDGSITFDFGDGPESFPPPGNSNPPAPEAPPVGPPEAIAPSNSPQNVDEDFPSPPDGHRWGGVYWEMNVIPGTEGGALGTTGADTVFPRVVGNIAVRFDSGDNRVLSLPPERITTARGLLVLPLNKVSATGYSLSLRPGFGIEISPVAERICCEAGDDEPSLTLA